MYQQFRPFRARLDLTLQRLYPLAIYLIGPRRGVRTDFFFFFLSICESERDGESDMVRQIVRNNERIVENDMNEGGRLGMNPMDATMVRTMNDDDDDEDDVFVDEG